MTVDYATRYARVQPFTLAEREAICERAFRGEPLRDGERAWLEEMVQVAQKADAHGLCSLAPEEELELMWFPFFDYRTAHCRLSHPEGRCPWGSVPGNEACSEYLP